MLAFSFHKCTVVMRDPDPGEAGSKSTREVPLLPLQLFYKSKIIPKLKLACYAYRREVLAAGRRPS